MGAAPTSALLSVGDELLLGQTIDTNAAWLGRRLSDLGIPLQVHFSVADDAREIRVALDRALEASELVVATGGLGPTQDDLTLATVAEALGRHLREDPSLLAELEARFLRRGFDHLPPTNRTQALVPEGGTALPNALGTAPGIWLEFEGKPVVLLPGVPREMKALFDGQVGPLIRRRFGARLAPPVHRVIRTTGISESVLAERVEQVLPPDPGPASVAFLPDISGVDLRLTVRGMTDRLEAEMILDDLEARLAPLVERYRYSSPSGDLAEAVGAILEGRRMTLAVAESCTGGLLAKRLTDHAGSSAWFRGGVVAYHNDIKESMLGVPPEVLQSAGAVSREVAEAMALGVAGRLGASAGIGITGVAGPGGGTEEKPVGTVWYAASLEGRVRARQELFPGDREMVRVRSAQAALSLLLGMLDEAWGAPDHPSGQP
jgi:nicotinamide-nucleotide amidase